MNAVNGRKGSRKRWLLFVSVPVLAFVLGYLARDGSGERSARGETEPAGHATEKNARQATTWTCSMHPQVQLEESGKCPICFMDLIPVEVEIEPGGVVEETPTLVLSETARRLARIRTVAVERRYPSVQVRMVGKVGYDETHIAYIAAHVPGRLDRLYVDYTWVPVQKGDHLADIYSPELFSAQEELLQAIAASRSMEASDLEIMRETAVRTVEAARAKLRLWGMLPEQIDELEQRGEASEHVTLYSPISGVIIDNTARQGVYVKTGTRLFTVVDLSVVWVRLEAYESDLEWIRLGQEVEFTVEAYPGRNFSGRVAFVDPVVDPATRTVGLRVHVDNEGSELKPEMLVRAIARARVAGAGRVFDPELAGKWISPMHPWVIKDRPGQCDVCGMELVPAGSLGFIPSDTKENAPLVIPRSAPLLTGERAIVYVETEDGEGRQYEGREVSLGPLAGDVYVVRYGLDEGERIVVEGNFSIDSALQIQAKPSMMNRGGEKTPPPHQHGGQDRMREGMDR